MKIENLDHLGLVAALVDEMGLVEQTDEVLAPYALNHISPGQVMKAIILNGLGFVSAPLYLFSEFFEGIAVEHLLGAGVTACIPQVEVERKMKSWKPCQSSTPPKKK